MNRERIAELAAMKQGSGLRAVHLRALDIECSRILGCEPPDRTVPRRRKYREAPSTGTHGVTLARNRVAWLRERLTA